MLVRKISHSWLKISKYQSTQSTLNPDISRWTFRLKHHFTIILPWNSAILEDLEGASMEWTQSKPVARFPWTAEKSRRHLALFSIRENLAMDMDSYGFLLGYIYTYVYIYILYPLVMTNIAMENGWFSQLETSIYKGFSMAMLNNQMVYLINHY